MARTHKHRSRLVIPVPLSVHSWSTHFDSPPTSPTSLASVSSLYGAGIDVPFSTVVNDLASSSSSSSGTTPLPSSAIVDEALNFEEDAPSSPQAPLLCTRLHNHHSPINSLPEDVLVEVFRLLVTDHFNDYREGLRPHIQVSERWSLSPPYAWLRYTHVCHWWFTVTHTRASLWTHVVVFRKSILKMILPRSRLLPLHVIFPVALRYGNSRRTLEDRACFALVLQQMKRLASLEFWHDLPVQLMGMLNLFMAVPLPKLRTLRTQVHEHRCPIPGARLRVLPNIQELHLGHTLWADIQYACQTSLRRLVIEEAGMFTVRSLLSTLRRIPLLEHLEIIQRVSGDSCWRIDEETSRDDIVDFPCLRVLKLVYCTSRQSFPFTAILDRLVLPCSAQVSCQFQGQYDDALMATTGVDTFVRAVYGNMQHDYLSLGQPPASRTFEACSLVSQFSERTGHTISAHLWPGIPSPHDLQTGSHAQYSFSLRSSPQAGHRPNALTPSALAHRLFPPSTRTLHLCIPEINSPESWNDAFGHLSALDSLTVSVLSLSFSYRVLRRGIYSLFQSNTSAWLRDGARAPLLFPNLKTLAICDDKQCPENFHPSVNTLSQLEDALKRRETNGRRVKELRLSLPHQMLRYFEGRSAGFAVEKFEARCSKGRTRCFECMGYREL
ncbi:hypothetical protein EIP91_007741 [Steccherinum ochraceum]|uniref:Uncharacterized protein n=1 Tax=Steccherinum ochraceum TaxID=92696 RepID=A0A4R0S0L7_9APHY|nr:hypothetical protein EIP91_007741 [Steccherinum ochraceum]